MPRFDIFAERKLAVENAENPSSSFKIASPSNSGSKWFGYWED